MVLVKLSFTTERADWAFVISATLVFALTLFVTAYDFVRPQGMVYRLNPTSILGFILFFAGMTLRLVGRKTLGRYYSYGLRTSPDQKLVKHGIYKHVRHPITLAAMMYSIGIPLILSSLYGLLLILGLIPLFLFRIEIEEKMLIERFGDDYREYRRKTKKLIPFIY